MDFKVADLDLADFGRTEISLAEHEMPGLMAMRERYGDSKPLAGARIAGLAAHDDPDRGPHRDAGRARRRGALGLLQHLLHPGPRRGGRRGGPERHRRRPRRACPVFAWKGETLEEYWWCTQQILMWPERATVRQHDPRRRWRRHDARPPRRRDGEVRRRAGPRLGQEPRAEGRLRGPQRLARREQGPLDQDRRRDQGRHRGDHHRRAPPLRHDEGGLAALPGHQRQRLGHQVASSTTSTAAATRSSTASTAPPTSSSAARSRSSAATATSARAAPSRCAARVPA